MKITDKEVIRHELPAEIDGVKVRGNELLMPLTFKCKISDINLAQMNAIRRTAIDELEVQALELVKLDTNDSYLIREMIADRIAEIPIKQQPKLEKVSSTDKDVYRIGPFKNGDQYKDVNTSIMNYIDKHGKDTGRVKDLCNKFTIFHLAPLTNLDLTMKIVTKRGYDKAQHSFVPRFVFRPIKEADPQSEYTVPDSFIVEFDTKGNIEPEELIKLCIQDIKSRLKYILDILPNIIERKKDLIIITIPNEAHTLANLIYTELLGADYKLNFCSYHVNHDVRNFDLQIRFDSEKDDKYVINIVTKAIEKVIVNFD